MLVVGVASFAFLVLASWCVGEGGEILGKKYDASIIGGIIIAWLNTAPETIFFVTALYGNNPGFAVGAVSGSSIVVCTVALGACLWIGGTARKSAKFLLQPPVKEQCKVLFASVVIPLLIVIWGFSLVTAFLGVAFYVAFIAHSILKKSHPPMPEKDDLEKGGHISDEDDEEEEEVSVPKGVGYLVVGGLLIFIFSSPFIDSVVDCAEYLQVNPTLLAFFLAPIASEMPEILESISLSRKGNSQNINIAYSNLVGGTISKTTLLLAILCIFGSTRGFEWDSPSYTVSMLLLTVCAAAASGIGFMFRYQVTQHGLFLFGLFVLCGMVQYYYNAAAFADVAPVVVNGEEVEAAAVEE